MIAFNLILRLVITAQALSLTDLNLPQYDRLLWGKYRENQIQFRLNERLKALFVGLEYGLDAEKAVG